MRTPKILPGILVVVPATILLTAQASLSEPASETCRASPGSSTPRGAHWFYRINPSDKRHCWYLGVADARAKANAAGRPRLTASAKPEPANAQDAAPATPAPDPAIEDAPAQMPPPPVAPTAVSFLEWSSGNNGSELEFAARWPDSLPEAQDLDRSDLASVATSYAERQQATDASAQMPARWPLTEAMSARQQLSTGETALRTFSLAGALAIALLLLAGWAAKFVRRKPRPHTQGSRQASAGRPNPFPHADFVDDAAGAPVPTPYRSSERWAPTPTDPADDLKLSLAELMNDLRRAAAACEAPGVPVRVAGGARSASHRRPLRERSVEEVQA